MTPALLALLAAAILAAGIGFALMRYQHRLVFQPRRVDGELHPNPADHDVPFEDVFFKNPSGLTLHGWWLPCPGATATLLFCHGNRGNLSDRTHSCVYYQRLGLNVFALDYRGYGRSEGTPSEAGLYEDAQAAWDYLCGERALDPAHIVILGRSLGGGVASHLASKTRPAAAIIESTFTSIADVARERFPRLPFWRIPFIRFDNAARIGNIDVPLLLVHSEDDDVIGHHHGQALAQRAGKHHRFVTIQGAHAGGHLSSGDAYTEPLCQFLHNAGIELAPPHSAGAQRNV